MSTSSWRTTRKVENDYYCTTDSRRDARRITRPCTRKSVRSAKRAGLENPPCFGKLGKYCGKGRSSDDYGAGWFCASHSPGSKLSYIEPACRRHADDKSGGRCDDQASNKQIVKTFRLVQLVLGWWRTSRAWIL